MDYQQNGVGVIDTFTNGAATAPSGDTPTAKSAESNGNHGGGIVSDSDSESHQQQKSRPTAAGGKLFEGFGDEIGEDVRLVVTLLANSGLLGPIPTDSQSSRPGTARIKNTGPPNARSNTAENSEFSLIGMREEATASMKIKSPNDRGTANYASKLSKLYKYKIIVPFMVIFKTCF